MFWLEVVAGVFWGVASGVVDLGHWLLIAAKGKYLLVIYACTKIRDP